MWTEELKNNITTVEELSQYFSLNQEELKAFEGISLQHPFSIPKYYLSLMDSDDPNDPIRKMMAPSLEELVDEGDFDTSGEGENTKLVGLQHKYAATALVLTTNVCAAYCRYCFRKRMVGLSREEVAKNFDNAFEYISEHKEINNVLLSGGDALMVPTENLQDFLFRLSSLEHINFIRIGTRMPVVFPDRVIKDQKLQKALRDTASSGKRVYITTHFNHPKEISEKTSEFMEIMNEANVIVSNQSVLLKGVNDDPTVLATVQMQLTKLGIIPYYIFQCRPVKYVKNHFQVPLAEGYKIVEKARSMMDGYSKRARYIMSHRTGKIEIVGLTEDDIFFKYHQAKNADNMGHFFSRPLDYEAGWLEDLPEHDEDKQESEDTDDECCAS